MKYFSAKINLYFLLLGLLEGPLTPLRHRLEQRELRTSFERPLSKL